MLLLKLERFRVLQVESILNSFYRYIKKFHPHLNKKL